MTKYLLFTLWAKQSKLGFTMKNHGRLSWCSVISKATFCYLPTEDVVTLVSDSRLIPKYFKSGKTPISLLLDCAKWSMSSFSIYLRLNFIQHHTKNKYVKLLFHLISIVNLVTGCLSCLVVYWHSQHTVPGLICVLNVVLSTWSKFG